MPSLDLQDYTQNDHGSITHHCSVNVVLCAQVVQVGEQNGLRFPREFALLVKQLLYFDRQVLLFQTLE